MICFLIFLSTVILAHPFPSDDLDLTVIDILNENLVGARPIKDRYSSDISQNGPVANVDLSGSVSTGCDLDSSSANILNDETIQRRGNQISCPSSFITPTIPSTRKNPNQANPSRQTTSEDSHERATSTGDHPCANTERPYWVTCGGPEVGEIDGKLIVINCLAGKSFKLLSLQRSNTKSTVNGIGYATLEQFPILQSVPAPTAVAEFCCEGFLNMVSLFG